MEKHESGRSMIEILGVLAIIGIISIGGIMGYKLALLRYQMSDLINTTNKYAFIVFEQCNSIYTNRNTSLASVKDCTPNTPGIKKFAESNLGDFPSSVSNQGIRFTGISIDEETKKHLIHTQIRFKTKDHCVVARQIVGTNTGCKEAAEPFILNIQTSEN